MRTAPPASTEATGLKGSLAYTMIRVRDLEASLDFYTRILGMKLMAMKVFPEGQFTLAFVGYELDGGQAPVTIELTHNWDRTAPYEIGTAFGHIAIRVDDVYRAAAALEAAGAELIRPAGPMKFGSEVIAFLADPDGYRIELVGGH